jgi:hypothetical protein
MALLLDAAKTRLLSVGEAASIWGCKREQFIRGLRKKKSLVCT